MGIEKSGTHRKKMEKIFQFHKINYILLSVKAKLYNFAP